ncbi:MAG: LptF/LptG family permease, partial [Bryobacter sp.]|nr:LptF/LptG family permease [Bryobacter sp.]
PQGDQALEAQKKNDVPVKPLIQIDTVPLAFAAYPQAGKPAKVALSGEPGQTPVDARIELHQRFAMPLACVLLALVGVPLGVTQHKAGKSFAFVMTVALAFFYYMSSISLIGLARKGTLRPEIAVWLPDAILILLGIFLISRLEKARRVEIGTYLRTLWDEWRTGRRQRQARKEAESARPLGPARRLRLFPHIIDTYILTTFLFYFFLLLSSFVLMTEVFTFFELLSDIVKNKIPMSRVLTYLVFLTPKLVYDSTPVSVLVAVLVTFGVLTKNNEVTAFKASGISLYRLAMPVLVASGAFSVLLFAFDHTILPDANRKQDAIRDEIKGRPRQTYLRPDRKWIMGRSGNRIYYYKGYDPWEHVMVNVSVYDLDPATFHLTRIITAERARWEPGLKNWVFQDGWRRTIQGTRVVDFQDFRGATATYAEIDEPPGYFLKEVKLHTQMNFQELAGYISELRQSGFDTIRLQVQLQNKFAVPLFALIMAMISVPFAFLTGNRGAMAGVGVSFGIAIAYFAVSRLFEQIGNVAQLPPAMAAWSPDMLFSLAGLYLLARMRT